MINLTNVNLLTGFNLERSIDNTLFLVDNNNNKVNIAKNGLDKSIEMLYSLHNCFDCVDSEYCVNCKNCFDCVYCINETEQINEQNEAIYEIDKEVLNSESLNKKYN